MNWLSDVTVQMNKRLKVEDTTTLFQALTSWPPTTTIGTNYLANTFYGLLIVKDNIGGDEVMIATNFLKGGETFHFSKNWTPLQGRDFYLYAYDFLMGKGWGGL